MLQVTSETLLDSASFKLIAMLQQLILLRELAILPRMAMKEAPAPRMRRSHRALLELTANLLAHLAM